MMRPHEEWPIDDARRTTVSLRGEYVAAGFTDRWLAAMVRGGVLAKARRGAYVAGPVWESLGEAGRHSVRARAVLAQARTEIALSHVSGLLEFDSPTWGLSLDDVDVTRLDGRIGRRECGVRPHRGQVIAGDVVVRNGVPVMTPTRLALESTTLGDVEHGMCVVSDLLHRRLTTAAQLSERYALMTHWPDTMPTDLVLRLSDHRFESIGETRAFHLCFSRSLPMPVPQYEIKDAWGRVVATVDFAWPELGVFMEFDGKVKYEKLLKPGQRASDVVVAEKRREDLIRRITGWRCLRLVWADLGRPDATAAMIRDALYPPSIAA